MLRPARVALSSAILAALFYVHAADASAQARVSIAGLATLGGTFSEGLGINASGQVSGDSSILGDAASHAFLYSAGSMLDLGTLGGSYSYGYAVNANGQVAGYSFMPGNLNAHAFLYSAGNMLDLGTLGGSNSYGYAINASGQVTGYAFLPGNGSFHAFSYSGGSLRDLGTLGGTASYGKGINASGQVTGSADTLTAGHAFLYSGGAMQDLGTLGGANSSGEAINASGQVAGYSLVSDSAHHAFLYSSGSMQDLGTLGGTDSYAQGINASGQVTGTSLTSGDTVYHAFLYSGGRMFDLNTLGLAGWTLYGASGINDFAQITGQGTNGIGGRAYVLTLHPDWQGGSGNWSDASRWSFAGMGSFGFTPGAPHDVLIHPGGASATVYGAADATVSSLTIGGDAGQLVTLNLNAGSTNAVNGTVLGANGALAGSGLLNGALQIQSGARVNVGAGESMQLAGGPVSNSGTMRVLGTGTNPANLDVGGMLTNNAGAQINLQNANVSFLGGLANSGQINTTFGLSTIIGPVANLSGGRIVVSNGAQATFFDDVANNGELRVSAGGAANFFGLVSGAGLFTGTGAVRYEGGFSPGNSPANVTVSTDTTYGAGSTVTMELGGLALGSGYDHVTFTGPVTLQGGALDVVWYGGWSGSAGQVYDLFDWEGGLTGTFGSVLLPTLASGLLWSTADLYNGGSISILAAVPEPRTYAMLLAGLGLLGFGARRKMASVSV